MQRPQCNPAREKHSLGPVGATSEIDEPSLRHATGYQNEV